MVRKVKLTDIFYWKREEQSFLGGFWKSQKKRHCESVRPNGVGTWPRQTRQQLTVQTLGWVTFVTLIRSIWVRLGQWLQTRHTLLSIKGIVRKNEREKVWRENIILYYHTLVLRTLAKSLWHMSWGWETDYFLLLGLLRFGSSWVQARVHSPSTFFHSLSLNVCCAHII